MVFLLLLGFYLCDMFQPPSQRNKDKEHWGSVKKCNRALAGSFHHGDDEDQAGVDVGDGGCQNYQDVHVGRVVF